MPVPGAVWRHINFREQQTAERVMEWKKVGKHWRFDKTIIEEWLLRHPERMASKPETSMPAPGSGGHAKAGTGK